MRLVLAILLASMVVPSPSWGQDTESPLGRAIAETLDKQWEADGHPPADRQTTWGKIKEVLAGGAFSGANWLKIGQLLGLPVGTGIAGGSYGGAGSENGFCQDFKYAYDFGGNLIVPAAPLKEPKGYRRGEQLWMYPYATNKFIHSPEKQGVIKFAIHMMNATLPEADKWAPVYDNGTNSINSSFVATTSAYLGPDGKVVPLKRRTVLVSNNSVAWASPSSGGPPAEFVSCDGPICTGGGGARHWEGNQSANTPSAWNIPTYTSVTANEIAAWAKSYQVDEGTCPLDKEFIRKLAQGAWQAAASQAGYNGVPPGRVEPENVKTGPTPPQVKDLAQQGTIPDPTGAPDPEPTPQPTAEPTGSPTDGPDWTNPGTAAPNPQSPTASSIVDAAFDWDFPSVEINLGSPSCPVYSADFFGHTVTLDIHCQLIEQSRAVISAMMILMFTIGAAVIVLRA